MTFDPSSVTQDTPLRLATAAALAFPDGSITLKALRKEADRDRLAIFRIAGKDFTTLRAIAEMIDKCRVQPNPRASTSVSDTAAKASTSFSTEAAKSAQAAARIASEKLRKPSSRTLAKSIHPTGGTVIPLASQSRTS